MLAIETEGLTKRYKEVLAVDGLDLRVEQGEVYGFLGRNGAGKTTTIRMLLGLIRPTAGAVRIFDTDIGVGSVAVLGAVGYLVESATAYPNLTVRENLDIQRRLTGQPVKAVDDAIEQLGLGQYAERRAGRLSLGNKQRLSLARALLHRPRLLILDEPANALDPAGMVEIRELLRTMADKEGVTVFMSSHILAEIAHIAHRIGIIHGGRLIEQLTYADLERRAESFLSLRVDDLPAGLNVLRTAGFETALPDPNRPGFIRIDGAAARSAEAADALHRDGLRLFELTPQREDLETYFLRLTEGGA